MVDKTGRNKVRKTSNGFPDSLVPDVVWCSTFRADRNRVKKHSAAEMYTQVAAIHVRERQWEGSSKGRKKEREREIGTRDITYSRRCTYRVSHSRRKKGKNSFAVLHCRLCVCHSLPWAVVRETRRIQGRLTNQRTVSTGTCVAAAACQRRAAATVAVAAVTSYGTSGSARTQAVKYNKLARRSTRARQRSETQSRERRDERTRVSRCDEVRDKTVCVISYDYCITVQ